MRKTYQIFKIFFLRAPKQFDSKTEEGEITHTYIHGNSDPFPANLAEEKVHHPYFAHTLLKSSF